MDQEIKDKIERLFLLKQKIKRLEEQAEALVGALPDLSLTGDKITFPPSREHAGFTVWQQTAKVTAFDQDKMHAAMEAGLESGDAHKFDVTIKAATLAKVQAGTERMDADVTRLLLSAVTVKDGKASWRFKAEEQDGQA